MIRYPAGPITPHGAYYLLKGGNPELTLTAFDGSITFHLMGGKSVVDRTRPESVQVKKDGLKGVIPPWKTITQKGATQDGATFLDALYDPTEIDITAIARGRDGKHLRRVLRDLIGSIDAKQTAELAFFTHQLGKWWVNPRWFKAPQNPMVGAQQKRQELPLELMVDDAFWRTYDDVAQFTGTTGFIPRVNVGDQPRFERVTCWGPGTFHIGNGPGSTDFVKFGPLLPNQIAQINMHPSKRGVVDLTSVAPTPEEQHTWQSALDDFLSFITGSDFTIFESIFGVRPPQANLYSLLQGRFSDAAAVPAKSPGNPAPVYYMPVKIEGGSGASRIIMAGTPLRRFPY